MDKSSFPFWKIVTGLLITIGLIFLAFGGYLGPLFGIVMEPVISIEGWISSRFSAMYDYLRSPQDIAKIIEENQILLGENAQLKTRIIELESQLAESDYIYGLLDYARARPGNSYIAATVIGRDPSPFMQYIIIDQGADDGIRHGMPIVTQQGLVGRVDAVSPRASRVQLITDAAAGVNVRVQKRDFDAIVVGSVTGDLLMEMIPQEVTLNEGELVLTSGLGGDYPPDIMVGQISSVRRSSTSLFQDASVQSAVDFKGLKAVLVIVNFAPMDIQMLIPTPRP
jgi:rod shape-determining protein MreC